MNEMLFHDLLHQPHKGIYALKIFIPAIRFLNNQFNCILMDVPVIKCRSSSLYSNRGIRAKAYPAHFIQIHSYIHLCFFLCSMISTFECCWRREGIKITQIAIKTLFFMIFPPLCWIAIKVYLYFYNKFS